MDGRRVYNLCFRFKENEFSDKKVANPLEGNYKAYYSLVNSKEQPQTTHGIVMMKTDRIVFRLM
jgi:hypothetical protein